MVIGGDLSFKILVSSATVTGDDTLWKEEGATKWARVEKHLEASKRASEAALSVERRWLKAESWRRARWKRYRQSLNYAITWLLLWATKEYNRHDISHIISLFAEYFLKIAHPSIMPHSFCRTKKFRLALCDWRRRCRTPFIALPANCRFLFSLLLSLLFTKISLPLMYVQAVLLASTTPFASPSWQPSAPKSVRRWWRFLDTFSA